MHKYKIEFDGYLEPEEYDSEDEAIEAADEMVSNSNIGAAIFSQPGIDEIEDVGDYWIVEIDECGIEVDRYQP